MFGYWPFLAQGGMAIGWKGDNGHRGKTGMGW